MTKHLVQLERYAPQCLAADTLHLIKRAPTTHQLALLCRLEAARVVKAADKLRALERTERAKLVKADLNHGKRGLTNAYKQLRGKPIGFVRKPDGGLASHPAEVGDILQKAWGCIHAGNNRDRPALVADVLKHRQHLHIAEPPALPELTGERFAR